MFRKYLLTSFIVLLFLLSHNMISVEANTDFITSDYNVGGTGPGNYSTIQDAIDIAQPGETVYVFDGTYYENLVINKPITLQGENKNNTIIDGNMSIYVLKITSYNVNVSGFTFQNASMGVYLAESTNSNTIKDNIVANNSNGVYLESSSNSNEIIENIIERNSEGINLYNSTQNNISNNYVGNHNAFGISLWDKSNHNIISNNVVKDNLKGICLFRWSNNNSIINNNLTGCSWGIHLEYSFYNNVSKNNALNGNSGVCLADSENNSITENILVELNYAGIFISNSENNNISDNFFLNNYVNIKIQSKPPSIKAPGFDLIILLVTLIIFILIMRRKR